MRPFNRISNSRCLRSSSKNIHSPARFDVIEHSSSECPSRSWFM